MKAEAEEASTDTATAAAEGNAQSEARRVMMSPLLVMMSRADESGQRRGERDERENSTYVAAALACHLLLSISGGQREQFASQALQLLSVGREKGAGRDSHGSADRGSVALYSNPRSLNKPRSNEDSFIHPHCLEARSWRKKFSILKKNVHAQGKGD